MGKEILEVGDVEVDLGAREIRRGGAVIEVQARVFDLFQYLLEHRQRVVTKKELLGALWPDQSVVPDVLSTAFYGLRRALQDDAKKPTYIRTVHRVGYQLVATVNARSSGANRFPALELRHAGFVGRRDEKALFDDMLAGKTVTQLLFVHGLPGIGKTSFLQELVYCCREGGVEHVWLSGETAGASVDAFVDALAGTIGCERSFDRVRERLDARPLVIFVDDVHLLAGLDEWMRQSLWPALPTHVRLVLAGRHPPSGRWRCDPAWPRGAKEVELASFTKAETRALFTARRAPTSHCDLMWSRSRGLPLALSLATEILQRDPQALGVFDEADVIETLVGWFTARIDLSAHQRVFELACLLDEVPIDLLGTLDAPESAGEGARWLSSLSFCQVRGEHHSPPRARARSGDLAPRAA